LQDLKNQSQLARTAERGTISESGKGDLVITLSSFARDEPLTWGFTWREPKIIDG
jgi:hypothetical protein